MVGHTQRLVRGSTTWTNSLEHTLHTLLEGGKKRVVQRIKQTRQSHAVSGRQNGIPTWLGHAGYLSHCHFRLGEPGNDADCEHEVEEVVVEGQGMGIANSDR